MGGLNELFSIYLDMLWVIMLCDIILSGVFQIPQRDLKLDRFQVFKYYFEKLVYQDWLDVMTKSKSHFVVNSLSKIRHKGWELYVVSRIIYLLDDLDVECH